MIVFRLAIRRHAYVERLVEARRDAEAQALGDTACKGLIDVGQ